ncbi:MAG: DsbA family protein [Nanoarchaeota archaeon]|nr:DsbA family protein [Nanoarchaeota archaeon]
MNPKTTIALITTCLILYLAVFLVVSYSREFERKPILSTKMDEADFSGLYDLYLSSRPDIAGRPWYGDKDAQVTVIAYLDPTSGSSRSFMQEMFPLLDEEFIQSGVVRFYQKSHVSRQDLLAENDNLKYANSLSCVARVRKEVYYGFLLDLFRTDDPGQLDSLLDAHGISEETFGRCLQKGNFPEVLQDVSEVESFGMVGVEPRFYVGIHGRGNTVLDGASYSRLRREILTKKLEIGV